MREHLKLLVAEPSKMGRDMIPRRLRRKFCDYNVDVLVVGNYVINPRKKGQAAAELGR